MARCQPVKQAAIVLLLAGCWSSSPKVDAPARVANAPREALPCGALDLEALFDHEQVGDCEVVADDLTTRVLDRGTLVLTHGVTSPPVIFDGRIPGPRGIRVGMTGAEVAAAFPDRRWVTCVTFQEWVACELAVPGAVEPEDSCDASEHESLWIGVPADPALVGGNQLNALLATRRITSIVLPLRC